MEYYKGYWMVTNRCNLRCSYCVLENAPDQLRAELSLEGKKELATHLYERLNFRRITLSGGEVLLIGKKPPEDFIALMRHMRQFRSDDPKENLELELYTNGTYLDERVAEEMEGVIDLVAVTIDSTDNEFLTQIGRNNKKFPNYYQNAIRTCKLLAERGIQVKLHSVVGTKNHQMLPEQVEEILSALENEGVTLSYWKFYQYMSYDVPDCDTMHAISENVYQTFQEKVEERLAGCTVPLHFKDNEEMNASLFNILSYGNAQYMREGDSWSSTPRTRDLRTYCSMEDLFAQNEIDPARFKRFHGVAR